MSGSKARPATVTLRTTVTLSDGTRIVGTWTGGPYIEVGLEGRGPVEVINVWNYESGSARLPFTQPALRRRVIAWVEEYGEGDDDALLRDIREHWPFY